ncbi:hypothetical protein BGW36DRAFT_376456 [Talaromyces proteolyticus]|uniref:Uncharacterized protein n=1 Tax=Talaromyces proteolyticus TaxID=1131652 RepID=A0AAD4KUE4_9EURO|nr:uncharacterized protein BGW36DRAFT_376456 [Talaromyces proteolyticus]KAH8698604.1 hypothetical protein BGW36DRAFT_376456 [Talaromyces proteolyticus]
MSESIAALRRQRRDELAKLADEHLQHDLQPADRDALKAAALTVSTWTVVGSAIGIGLGFYVAFRLRGVRKQVFEAFKAQEKPVSVLFADGRTESIPDITPLLKPSSLGDFATYFFASAGGLFLGGELGLLGGSARASRSITKDPETRKRIESAFRKYRADMLRREADNLDSGEKVWDRMF